MSTSEPVTYWYRFEDRLTGDGEHSSGVEVVLYKLAVVRRTPCGVRLIGLQHRFSKPRLVLHGLRKKYACETIEEAAESFRARKRHLIRILQARMNDAEDAIALIDEGSYRTTPDWYTKEMRET